VSDIGVAVNAGYTVTIHTSPIQVPGWRGSGYIIADQHGNGMYMISGGENGAYLLGLYLGMFLSIMLFMSEFGAKTPAFLLLAAGLLVMIYAMMEFYKNIKPNAKVTKCFLAGFAVGYSSFNIMRLGFLNKVSEDIKYKILAALGFSNFVLDFTLIRKECGMS